MRRIALVVAAVALVLSGCGGSDEKRPPLVVSAAASLKDALTQYGDGFQPATVRYSFAGSDQLAAQIEHGVRPDVFASANTKLPEQLFAKGLVERPRVFASNRLVLAVPGDSTRVGSLADLAKPGVKVGLGAPDVPVGAYAREVLGRLPAAQRRAILANVRTNEPDVAGIVGKLTQGAVDAGLVYVTDVKASGGRLRAIALPTALQPRVAYGVAIVKGAKHPEQARAYVEGLLAGDGRAALRSAGFEEPPSA